MLWWELQRAVNKNLNELKQVNKNKLKFFSSDDTDKGREEVTEAYFR